MSEFETTLQRVQALKETIADKPPYITGVIPLVPGSTTVFFGKEGNTNRLDLLNPTNESIDLLAKACDPATFGRGDQDVLDESYRKAGKLNSDDFAINFDLAGMGLTKAIQTDLLSAQDEERPIRLELYKLNVYGPGSFFKAHRDTPRGKAMFGSLVLVLPIQHSGGQLLLRQDSQEWGFDFAPILAQQPNPSVSYIAFYGDIEHEVLPVQSGHRVTISYNLYFDETPLTLQNVPVVRSSFETTLSQLLQDPSFLPAGGIMGFPLEYLYPVDKFEMGMYRVEIDHIINNLKGVDAFVHYVCTSFGLKTSVRVVYEFEDITRAYGYIKRNPPTHILLDHLPSSIIGSDPYSDMLGGYRKGIPIRSASATAEEDPERRTVADWKERTMWWLGDPDCNAFNRQLTVLKEYGNDASLEFMYGNFCFVIEVGPFGSRGQGGGLSA